jgi:hypothetical protein
MTKNSTANPTKVFLKLSMLTGVSLVVKSRNQQKYSEKSKKETIK